MDATLAQPRLLRAAQSNDHELMAHLRSGDWSALETSAQPAGDREAPR